MNLRSHFKEDLEKERLLFRLLDSYYQKHLKHYTFLRIRDKALQLKGVDLILTHNTTKRSYYIDEKAQLDYINEELPTFAFEISYQKNGDQKKGWFFDTKKETDFYALITAIYADAPNEFTSCKITLVNRKKLIHFLKERGIDYKELTKKLVSLDETHGKHTLESLLPYTEGYLYVSHNNKAEKPYNLILRLNFLLENGLAKRLI
jgi:hypothetical protein